EFPARTAALKQRLANGEALDDLLPEAFALVREASLRVNNERHFDVQLLGGIGMHRGQIAEMKTGEGKTLAATAPAYLNALTGRGVHIVTPNDYLARRDSQWMGAIYAYLGLNVGLIQHGLEDAERRLAYGADITYGTNNEYGFDYLRDNMKFRLEDYVQRPFYYAIVDEVDSILIDEARTPLIISGPTEESTDKYYQIHKLLHGLSREIRREEVSKLSPAELNGIRQDWERLEDSEVVREGDYSLDEKARTIHLTERGAPKVEQRLREKALLGEGSLFDFENIELLHHVNQALKATYQFRRDVDYVVKDGKVVIVDEFTGRLMPGRRFSDGLHQALEAKEDVRIERESQTYATITFQNYFRMYQKLAGMTGTAKTEEEEFIKIYNMDVLVVPTNRPMIREDQADVIYKTKDAKLRAVVRDLAELHETGQPVLVGTISIEASEELSRRLQREGIAHTVLNAKFHEQEAEIVAHAGEAGTVTIATNMAGRGTDIKLGPGVVERGGLFIMGTERHESRRIDNQLRGRSGRQGDPGASRFYLSLEDDLMRIFGGERIAGLMTRLRVEDDEAITHVLISRAIENAQKRVEGHNFEIRKHVLEYDDVMNKQREVIYGQRREILGEGVETVLLDLTEDVLEDLIDEYIGEKRADEWDVEGFSAQFHAVFGQPPEAGWQEAAQTGLALQERLMGQLEGLYRAKREALRGLIAKVQGQPPTEEHLSQVFQDFGRHLLLSIHDNLWKDHLLSMDHLREGIGLVGYAQKKPIDEYKRAGYELFADLMSRIANEAITSFFRAQFSGVEAPPVERKQAPLSYNQGEEAEAEKAPKQVRKIPNWGKKKASGGKRKRPA
ncbi:MAG TPA: preprotein translocase subunit SecA, partial [bacterium]|nr:preprotein translocase subunit SecA [bacterium]